MTTSQNIGNIFVTINGTGENLWILRADFLEFCENCNTPHEHSSNINASNFRGSPAGMHNSGAMSKTGFIQ